MKFRTDYTKLLYKTYGIDTNDGRILFELIFKLILDTMIKKKLCKVEKFGTFTFRDTGEIVFKPEQTLLNKLKHSIPNYER